ncbi:uncharacterized protein J8A68_002166 [[Candida] subhashii]|uniref:Alpha-1,3-mannosyltransferase n=1 Tax=[Candida] subhashii TaxID=561895 RepID=A0A8J5UJ79_9ASCO|nr:uncharacterized protein J8A68_002166 [[Candida] subhashii]KAG7664308.1 hypothetical protein J8A68_002166 [[Candida] subhashii]
MNSWLPIYNLVVPNQQRNQQQSIFSFDLISERNSFLNPIYAKWLIEERKSKPPGTLSAKCIQYFSDLSSLLADTEILDIEGIQSQAIDPTIYKKKKWIRDLKTRLKQERFSNGGKGKELSDKEIEEEFILAAKEQSKLEKSLVFSFNHMRVFGKCFAEQWQVSDGEDKKLEAQCTKFQRQLYPWISGRWPKFSSWKGENLDSGKLPKYDSDKYTQEKETKCFIEQLQRRSNGKGIVIPLYPKSAQNPNQIENINRLIQVLRGIRNKLPIQIMYISDEGFSQQDRNRLIETARTGIRYLPRFREAQMDDYPKQDLWFVDLRQVKNTKQHPILAKQYLFNNPNFILSLSMIFNSFEEVIVLSQDSIPLLDPIEYFDDQRYKETGMLFFRSPSHYSDRPKRFQPGFHEVTNLIRSKLTPSDFDTRYFNIHPRKDDTATTGRFFDDSFQNILDPSLIIINKSKNLNGLLLSANLQLYNIPAIRLTTETNKLSPDFIWIGQELAGTNDHISFNHNFAVSAGLLTPESNLPKDVTQSSEICSSSWGQLSDADDVTLISMTSHQLQNWIYDEAPSNHFHTLLKDKYKTTFVENVKNPFNKNEDTQMDLEKENNEIFDTKISLNPLMVENIIRPPTIVSPIYVHGYDEPSDAWVQQPDFTALIHPYYCTYDVIGKPPKEGARGMVINVGEEMRERLYFVFDLWLEGPEIED